jgi:hypothetical protein
VSGEGFVFAKLAGFALVLAVLFGGAALAGQIADPDAPGGDAEAQEAGHEAEGGHGASPGDDDEAGMPVRGLAVAENGLRVVVDDPELRRDRQERLRFRIVDDGADTVRDFDVEHTKRMHLILVRRDLTGFQHLHPTMAADGTWSTDVRLPDAGSYRLFADFSRSGKPTTLASDLRVDGEADLHALPAPQATDTSDGGYDVRLDAGSARPGHEADLSFTVTKDGRTVRTEPYLGAGGHLVALREGDLAYLHVHPTEAGHGADDGDAIGFAATFPTEGSYRLFLQFQVDGRVQTVGFTQEVK